MFPEEACLIHTTQLPDDKFIAAYIPDAPMKHNYLKARSIEPSLIYTIKTSLVVICT